MYKYYTYTIMEPSKIRPEQAAKIPKTPVRVMISWPEEARPVWEKFLAICKRDGHSASAEIREFIREQVEKRDPGNPQRPLEAFPGKSELTCEHEWFLKRKDFIPAIFQCSKCGAWQTVKP